jgi:hypothetical protein
MRQLFHDSGTEYCLFIRYNPDKYKSSSETIPLKKREEILIKFLQKYYHTKPEYNLSVIYLFYDGFDLDNVKEIDIDPYTVEI